MLLPIFSVFIIGFIIGKTSQLDVKSLSYVAMYVFYPFLAFKTFYTSHITIDFLYVTMAVSLLVILNYIFISVLSRVYKYNKKRKHAMLLAGVFMNGGNYGLPVVLFALGDEAFVYALMIMAILSIFMNSLGLYIATNASDDRVSWRQALIGIIKIPILPAILLGVLFQVVNIKLPPQVEEVVILLSDAAVPIIMIVLGIQLSTVAFGKIALKAVGSIVMTRLFISPILAMVIVYILGLGNSLVGVVFVIIAAMPTAANTTMFSVQFDVEPDVVSTSTLFSTLFSLLSLPIWLYILV